MTSRTHRRRDTQRLDPDARIALAEEDLDKIDALDMATAEKLEELEELVREGFARLNNRLTAAIVALAMLAVSLELGRLLA